MRTIIHIVITLVILGIMFVIASLVSNEVSWNDAPGFAARLQIYLTTNVAETSEHSAFPELRTRHFQAPPAEMLTHVRTAIQALGWTVTAEAMGPPRISAVVTTPWLRFKDDVIVSIKPSGSGSAVHVTSRSRIGKGDLGANAHHIRRLYRQLDDHVR